MFGLNVAYTKGRLRNSRVPSSYEVATVRTECLVKSSRRFAEKLG